MKILLLSNYFHDQQESMQRFAAILGSGLLEAGHEVRICRPRAYLGRLRRSERGLGKWLGYVDKFAVFPSALRAQAGWADVVHICDHSNSIYAKHLSSVPHVVTCHDLLAIRSALGEIPQNRTGWTGRQLQRMILRGLARTQHVVCVSEATRADLLRAAGIPEERVSRAYNGLNYPYSRMEAGEALSRIRELQIDAGKPFLLHVGGNQWYKNRVGVLRVFSAFRKRPQGRDFRLIMVGKPWTAEMRRLVAEQKFEKIVFEVTGVAAEDLRALYSTATMMLFPSLAEGFGWPIIEAQACGCPVVTSGRAPMNEVGGDAAVYVDPEDPESAAAAIEASLPCMPGLRIAGLRNAKRFDTSAMIQDYLSLYERVRQKHPAVSRFEKLGMKADAVSEA